MPIYFVGGPSNGLKHFKLSLIDKSILNGPEQKQKKSTHFNLYLLPEWHAFLFAFPESGA